MDHGQLKRLLSSKEFFIQVLKLFEYWTSHLIQFLDHGWLKKATFIKGIFLFKFWNFLNIENKTNEILKKIYYFSYN